MKKILLILLSLFLCTNIFAANFKDVVILGDSLSDNGNILNITKVVPQSPPYYKGRFSNGPTWADSLDDYYYSKYFITTKNYAYGGATAYLHDPSQDDFIAPITLEGELYQYELANVFSDKSKTLFAVFMGANDYLYDRQFNLDKLTNDVVTAISNTMNTLISQGAKTFLVFNLPDLARTPYGVENHLTDRYHAVIDMHNKKLADAMKVIQSKNPSVKIVYMDLNAIFTYVLDNPDEANKKYGTHVTELLQPCWGGDWFPGSGEVESSLKKDFARSQLAQNKNFDEQAAVDVILKSPELRQAYELGMAQQDGKKPCANPDEHFYWDIVHPTAVIHRVFGQIVIETLQNAGEG